MKDARNGNAADVRRPTEPRVWAESDITLARLAVHLRDSGLAPAEEGSGIILHTADGIGYLIRLDCDRQFVRFSTLLPLDPLQPLSSRKDFALALNEDLFLPSFSIDGSGDLHILYVMSYRQGLIAGQFMAMVHRFGSLLDYLVGEHNADGMISLAAADEADSDSMAAAAARPKRLLN